MSAESSGIGAEYLLGFAVDPQSLEEINQQLGAGLKSAVTAAVEVVVKGDLTKLHADLAKPIPVDVVPTLSRNAMRELKAAVAAVFTGEGGFAGLEGAVGKFESSAGLFSKAVEALNRSTLPAGITNMAEAIASLKQVMADAKNLRALPSPAQSVKEAKQEVERTRQLLSPRQRSARAMRADEYIDAESQRRFGGRVVGIEREVKPPVAVGTGKNRVNYRVTDSFAPRTLGNAQRSVTYQQLESGLARTLKLDTRQEDFHFGGYDRAANAAQRANLKARAGFEQWDPKGPSGPQKTSVKEILTHLNVERRAWQEASQLAKEVIAKDIGGYRKLAAAMARQIEEAEDLYSNPAGNLGAKKQQAVLKDLDSRKGKLTEVNDFIAAQEQAYTQAQARLQTLKGDIHAYNEQWNQVVALEKQQKAAERRAGLPARAAERLELARANRAAATAQEASGQEEAYGALPAGARVLRFKSRAPGGRLTHDRRLQDSPLGSDFAGGTLSDPESGVAFGYTTELPADYRRAKADALAQLGIAESRRRNRERLDRNQAQRERDPAKYYQAQQRTVEDELAARRAAITALTDPAMQAHGQSLRAQMAKIQTAAQSNPEAAALYAEMDRTLKLRDDLLRNLFQQLTDLEGHLAAANQHVAALPGSAGSPGRTFDPEGNGSWLLGQQIRGAWLPSNETGTTRSYTHDRGHGEIEHMSFRKTALGMLPGSMSVRDTASGESYSGSDPDAEAAAQAIDRMERLAARRQALAQQMAGLDHRPWLSDRTKSAKKAESNKQQIAAAEEEIALLKQAGEKLTRTGAKIDADRAAMTRLGASEYVQILKTNQREMVEAVQGEAAALVSAKEAELAALRGADAQLSEEAKQHAAEKAGGGGGLFQRMGFGFLPHMLIGEALWTGRQQMEEGFKHATGVQDGIADMSIATKGGFSKQDSALAERIAAVFSPTFLHTQEEVIESLGAMYRLTDQNASAMARLKTAALGLDPVLKFTAITGMEGSEALSDMNATAHALGKNFTQLTPMLGKILAVSKDSVKGFKNDPEDKKEEGAAPAILKMVSRFATTGRMLGLDQNPLIAFGRTLLDWSPQSGEQLGGTMNTFFANLHKARKPLEDNGVVINWGKHEAVQQIVAQLPRIVQFAQQSGNSLGLPNQVQSAFLQTGDPRFMAQFQQRLKQVDSTDGTAELNNRFKDKQGTPGYEIEQAQYRWQAFITLIASKLLPVWVKAISAFSEVVEQLQRGEGPAASLVRTLMGVGASVLIWVVLGKAISGAGDALTGLQSAAKLGEGALGSFLAMGLLKGALLATVLGAVALTVARIGDEARLAVEKTQEAEARKSIGENAANVSDIESLQKEFTTGPAWFKHGWVGKARLKADRMLGGLDEAHQRAYGLIENEFKIGGGGPSPGGVRGAAEAAKARQVLAGLEAMAQHPGQMAGERGVQLRTSMSELRTSLARMDALKEMTGTGGGTTKLSDAERKQLLHEMNVGRQFLGRYEPMKTSGLEQMGFGVQALTTFQQNQAKKDPLYAQMLAQLQQGAHAGMNPMGGAAEQPQEATAFELRVEAFQKRMNAFKMAMDVVKSDQDEYRNNTDLARIAVEQLVTQEQHLSALYQGRDMPSEAIRQRIALLKEQISQQLLLIGAMKEESKHIEVNRFRMNLLVPLSPRFDQIPTPALPVGGVAPGAGTATTDLQPQLKAHWAMASAALGQAGIPHHVTSGFRTLAEQQYLWDTRMRDPKTGKPRGMVARPGLSGHEFGRALDISFAGATPEQIARAHQIMQQNGFIRPYGDRDKPHWELASLRPAGSSPSPDAIAPADAARAALAARHAMVAGRGGRDLRTALVSAGLPRGFDAAFRPMASVIQQAGVNVASQEPFMHVNGQAVSLQEIRAGIAWHESHFQPGAVGPLNRDGQRPYGLYQFKPQTAAPYLRTLGKSWPEFLGSPGLQTQVFDMAFMAGLHRSNGDVRRALSPWETRDKAIATAVQSARGKFMGGETGLNPQTVRAVAAPEVDLADMPHYAAKFGIAFGSLDRQNLGQMQAFNAARQAERHSGRDAAMTGPMKMGGIPVQALVTAPVEQSKVLLEQIDMQRQVLKEVFSLDQESAKHKIEVVKAEEGLTEIWGHLTDAEADLVLRPLSLQAAKVSEAVRQATLAYHEHGDVLKEVQTRTALYGETQMGVAMKLRLTNVELTTQKQRFAYWDAQEDKYRGLHEVIQPMAAAIGTADFGYRNPEIAQRIALMQARGARPGVPAGFIGPVRPDYYGAAVDQYSKERVTPGMLKALGLHSTDQFIAKYGPQIGQLPGGNAVLAGIKARGFFTATDIAVLQKAPEILQKMKTETEGLADAARDAKNQYIEAMQQLGRQLVFDAYKVPEEQAQAAIAAITAKGDTARTLAQGMGLDWEKSATYIQNAAEHMTALVDQAQILQTDIDNLTQAKQGATGFWQMVNSQNLDPEQARVALGLPILPLQPDAYQQQIDAKTGELASNTGARAGIVGARLGQKPENAGFLESIQMARFAFGQAMTRVPGDPEPYAKARKAIDDFVDALQSNASSSVTEFGKRLVENSAHQDQLTQSIDLLNAAHLDATSQTKLLATSQAEAKRIQEALTTSQQEELRVTAIQRANAQTEFYQDTIKGGVTDFMLGKVGPNAEAGRRMKGQTVLAQRVGHMFESVFGQIHEQQVTRMTAGWSNKLFQKIGLNVQQPPELVAAKENTKAVTDNTTEIKTLNQLLGQWLGVPVTGSAGSGEGAGTSLNMPAMTMGFHPDHPLSGAGTAAGLLGAAGAMLAVATTVHGSGGAAKGAETGDASGKDGGAAGLAAAAAAAARRSKAGPNPSMNPKNPMYGVSGKWDAGRMLGAAGAAYGAFSSGAAAGHGVVGGLMGAAEGAMSGAAFGPVGMAAGAAIGLLGSIFGSSEEHRKVTEKIFNQMPKRQDVIYAAANYLPFSAYAGGRFSKYEFAVNLSGITVGDMSHAQRVGATVADVVAPMLKSQIQRGPVLLRGT